MLVTALAPKIGYDKAANIAKKALKNNTTLKTEIIKSGLMNEKDFKKVVDPKKMIQPEQDEIILFVNILNSIQFDIFIAPLLNS